MINVKKNKKNKKTIQYDRARKSFCGECWNWILAERERILKTKSISLHFHYLLSDIINVYSFFFLFFFYWNVHLRCLMFYQIVNKIFPPQIRRDGELEFCVSSDCVRLLHERQIYSPASGLKWQERKRGEAGNNYRVTSSPIWIRAFGEPRGLVVCLWYIVSILSYMP